MSAFTPFGAPGCQGPSTKDITDLINAYMAMQTKLQEHVQHTCTDASDVHGVKTQLATKADSADVYTKSEVDSSLAGKADSNNVYTKSQVDTSLASAVATKANSADVYTKTAADALFATQQQLNNKADAATVAAKANSADVYTKAAANDAFFKKNQFINGIVKDTVCVLYTKNIATMQYAGTGAMIDTDTQGLYLIGAMYRTPSFGGVNTAIADIRYLGGSNVSMSVKVIMSCGNVNGVYRGNILAVVSCTPDAAVALAGLRFHMVLATVDSVPRVYLGMSGAGIESNGTSAYVSGNNFWPLGYHYAGEDNFAPRISSVDSVIATTNPLPVNVENITLASAGISIQSLAIDSISDTSGSTMLDVESSVDPENSSNTLKTMYIGNESLHDLRLLNRPTIETLGEDEHGDPVAELHTFVTEKEAFDLCSTPIGGIIMWPKFEEIHYDAVTIGHKALNPPDGWLSAYGDIVAAADYPMLVPLADEGILEYADIGHTTIKLPKIDYGIIKVTAPTFANVISRRPVNPDITTLTDAVHDLSTQLASEIASRNTIDGNQDTAISTITNTTIPDAINTAKGYTDTQVGQTVAAEQAARIGADTTILDYLEDVPVADSVEHLPQTAPNTTDYPLHSKGVVFNGTTITTYEVDQLNLNAETNLYDIVWVVSNA